MRAKVALALFHSHSYHEYRKLVEDLLIEGKSTGKEQSGELTNYSKLNDVRMNRLDKTIHISDENVSKLNSLSKEYIWLVLTEGWCGDAAQILPVLNKMAVSAHQIELKIILRDENEDLMNSFLTNGTKSIPKVLVIDKDTGLVLGSWGPRPQAVVDLIRNYKEKHGAVDETVKADLQMWYLHDKGITVQNELIQLMFGIEKLDLHTSMFY